MCAALLPLMEHLKHKAYIKINRCTGDNSIVEGNEMYVIFLSVRGKVYRQKVLSGVVCLKCGLVLGKFL